MSSLVRAIGLIVTALILGCSAHRTRVDCEGHLKPINTPAPVVSAQEPHR